MISAAESMRRTVEGITALYENGDPAVIINHVNLAPDEGSGLAIVSGLALMAASAMQEIDRLAGGGAGIAWLQRQALDFQVDDDDD